MDIDKAIFKAYDIRGVYPDQISQNEAYAIGRAIATLFIQENPGEKITLVVGGDVRLSTPTLKEYLVNGLLDNGIDVVDIGLVSTPTYYYAVASGEYDGGVQVSASHNPKQYNGFKIVRKKALSMSGDTGIQALYDLIIDERFVPKSPERGKVIIKEGVLTEAVARYIHEAGTLPEKRYKIVIDTGNAMGGLDYPALFSKIPADIIWMNGELDGAFPSHEADPSKEENTRDLQEMVRMHHADFGVAADGDSDRIFIIDETGTRVPSVILYTILAKLELQRFPQGTLAHEIRFGFIVEDEFKKKGIPTIAMPVGSSLIKKGMLESGAIFGGEVSGHFFFTFPFGVFEAPPFAVLRLMQYIAREGKLLSQIVQELDRYASSGEVSIEVSDRKEIEQKLTLVKERYGDGKLVLLDGVKVEFPDYWFSLRASNTEPVMRLIIEAKSKELMEAKRDELLQLLA